MSAPTSPWLPTRSVVCPACGTPFPLPATGRCAGCEVDLTHPAVDRLLELEDRRRAMVAEHDQLLAALLATAPAGVEAEPLPVWARAPHHGISRAGDEVAPRAPRTHLTVPTLLALAGVALLTTAAVVFTAVVWTTLPSWTQAVILLAATVIAGTAAFALARREIPTAAAALGVVTMSFAAVDVVGLQRTGLVDLEAFVVPAAATVAAVVGWWLARHHLRWVATAGALAAVVTAGSLTAALAGRYELAVVPIALVGLGCSLALAATIVSWPTLPARVTAGVGAGVGATLAGLLTAAGLADGETGLLAGLGVLVLVIAALVAGSRWTPLTLTPAVLLVTLAVAAAAAHLGAEELQLVAVVGVPVVALTWALPLLREERRPLAALGLGPAALALVLGTLVSVAPLVTSWVTTIAGGTGELIEPWAPAVATLLGATALAFPPVRRHAGWIGVGILVLASGAVPVAVAWPSLLVLALAGTGLLVVQGLGWSGTARGPGPRELPAALPVDPLAPLTLAAGAVGWAAGVSWMLTVAAVGAVVVGGVTATMLAGAVTGPKLARRGAASLVALAAAGLAAWAAADAAGLAADVALGAGLVTVFVLAAAVPLLRDEPRPVAGTAVGVVATVLLPTSATTLRATGVLLLVAATGWLVLSVLGWWHARWLTASAVSVGIGVLLGDAGVTTVEAYTVVPALALGAAGIWHLVEDRSLPTAVALTPALAVGLVPSLLVLAGDPREVVRTVGLVLVAGALAAAGARLRWLAPTVAGAVTAVVVALTQLSMVVDVVPRWVTFAVVGILLVYLAASYERQRARARTVADRLSALR
jgi:hypothetical protein